MIDCQLFPEHWLQVPDWQLENARTALRPLPGTAIVELQPEVKARSGSLIVPDSQTLTNWVTEQVENISKNQPTAGTVVGVGADIREHVSRSEWRDMVDRAFPHSRPKWPLSERWDDHAPIDIKVGDRVVVAYDHGSRFSGWYTPPYQLSKRQQLIIFGRHGHQAYDFQPYCHPLFVPLDTSILATIDPTNMTEINPTGRNVLIRRHSQNRQTASGLYMPDSMQYRSTKCDVLKAGPACTMVKPGEERIFQPAMLRLISGLGDDDLAIIPEAGILA